MPYALYEVQGPEERSLVDVSSKKDLRLKVAWALEDIWPNSKYRAARWPRALLIVKEK